MKKKKKFAAGNTLLLAAAGILLGISLYRWNAQNILGNQMPMPFGYGLSVVLSGSMEPELRVNDLAVVRETKDVEVGDIIVYQSGDMLILHRVIEKNGTVLITKGDANNAEDEAVPLEKVKGKMVFHIPTVGGLLDILRQPAIAAVVMLAALLCTELSYRKKKDEDSEELKELREEIRKLLQETEKHKP